MSNVDRSDPKEPPVDCQEDPTGNNEVNLPDFFLISIRYGVMECPWGQGREPRAGSGFRPSLLEDLLVGLCEFLGLSLGHHLELRAQVLHPVRVVLK